jgi:hypothetical protein
MSSIHETEPSNTRKRKVKRVPVQDLWIHPLHAELFDPWPEAKVAKLAAAMEQNQPAPVHVEIAPATTVLFGAIYLEAARRAGWTHLEVVVRTDLEGVPDRVKELEIIDLHLAHGALSKMTFARCLDWAQGIAPEVPQEWRRDYQVGTLKEVVAQYLGVGLRSAERYVCLLDLPRSIQRAFDQGRIRIGLAEGVRGLGQEAVAAIARGIEDGGDPRAVVNRHLKPTKKRARPGSHQWEAYRKVNQFLSRAGPFSS